MSGILEAVGIILNFSLLDNGACQPMSWPLLSEVLAMQTSQEHILGLPEPFILAEFGAGAAYSTIMTRGMRVRPAQAVRLVSRGAELNIYAISGGMRILIGLA